MDKKKIEALLEALRIMLEADLVDLESLRLALKPNRREKEPKQGKETDQQDD